MAGSIVAICLAHTGCKSKDNLGASRLIKIRKDMNQGVDYYHPPAYFEHQVHELEARYRELGLQEFYQRYFRTHLLANSKKLNYTLPPKSEP